MPTGKLLLQDEVAEILRCSVSTIRRLRQSGKLAYLPGRPVLIDEADLAQYQETVRPVELPPKTAKPQTGVRPPESASALARRIWLARRNYQLAKADGGKRK
ncbi:helix-turn-helix domain-containing protein [Mesorhizobium sp. M1060]|uniref:helix-turn-helix domain-containing protein n=1 Tax=Mesorhizobium sp. M1060 TaxID=2957052 RepID=UPI0009DD36E3|nr:helix-turn-helix domain-containing protein [Mesorhizobium sp. L2C054A000]